MTIIFPDLFFSVRGMMRELEVDLLRLCIMFEFYDVFDGVFYITIFK